MKISFFFATAMTLALAVLLQFAVGSSIARIMHIEVPNGSKRNTNLALEEQHLIIKGKENRQRKPSSLVSDATGSSLPDCSHACGPCFPCKRVMVGFKCSISEPCPVVYRCLCKGRFFHVPSN